MRYLLHLLLLLSACGTPRQPQPSAGEPHRPLMHFTPDSAWMNDPNGLVYANGVYHLFYQHYPDSTVWGPMHWGHATSRDLITWQHQPIALFPDSLGYIFSGSVVADSANTSGFGSGGKVPLVAVFTHHHPEGEKRGRKDYQVQSLAYSLDDGSTWTKYSGNPVLSNPGIKDFRDPKVRWHAGTRRWIMSLATLDRITFYSSPDLKGWTRESDFGADLGAHGGVWECPDLFPLQVDGKEKWVLLVSINPGGPNGGSATQYFTGSFDGHRFTPDFTGTRWIDWGPDNYAGVTWSGTGARKIFLGWMSNWQYANLVPTQKWRSAMTVPRDLQLRSVNGQAWLASMPVPELNRHLGQAQSAPLNGSSTIPLNGTLRLRVRDPQLQNLSITLSNTRGQKTVIGFDAARGEYYIDRSASGKVGFEKGFAARTAAPRPEGHPAALELDLFIDVASVELFAEGGLHNMTGIFFPDEPYTQVEVRGKAAQMVWQEGKGRGEGK